MRADVPVQFDVVVLGSANVDHLIRVQNFPKHGETVAADDYAVALGGKGANQALAAARSGVRVAFAGAVGDDDAGVTIVSLLKDDGVDTSHVETVAAPTGSAFVSVDSTGMNQIVIAAGANAHVRRPEELPDGAVLLVQLESPVEAVRSAMLAFRGIVVLNPAPSGQAGDLIDLADVLVPNAAELADLANAERVPVSPQDALILVRKLGYQGAVVVTLGPSGALVVDGDEAWHVAAPRVDAVDTTGAGDAFCGALAARLARGESLLEGARWGVAAGTATVTRPGAGAAMPDASHTAAYLPEVTLSMVGVTAPSRPAAAVRSGFAWGVATSAYQVEGAVSEDGRGESIWDVFARRPGAVAGEATASQASDHYHRWEQDITLMAELGVSAYRFSVSWPRVAPDGIATNEAGLDFYDRLTDALLAHGITPYVTLYHWDLPQALARSGGWLDRGTAGRFANYAATVSARLGDRVTSWLTINEPFEASMRGYAQGRHAPGRTSPAEGLRAAHHLLLAHGLGMQALRASRPAARAGIVLNLYPVEPASPGPQDADAADRLDLAQNRLFLDPILAGSYSPAARALFERCAVGDVLHDGDETAISAPMDFLGVNYYTTYTVAAGDGQPAGAPSAYPGAEDVRFVTTARTTDMGLPVRPDGLGTMLRRLANCYAPPPILITENGAAYRDLPGSTGIEDFRRAAFLRRHIAQVTDAVEAGLDVRGYFAWTLLDNFEWSDGYTQRFGIVAVDFPTGDRTPKASYRWYRRYLRQFDPAGDGGTP
jgi:beta-glucosidase